ncbi:succinyl-CoA synthetase, alpha subunit [Thermanaerovibrio velox DSM 12556]|uniref:Succinyl-CoA synthetase, alpha subunit n=1 Tax=Thermanaerovibrio velox DSM 12556 TaxID=926567 RepID=H0UP10_9BACT|nr:fatty-acid metabolism regulator protein [Thermanaerovibrio velox]EHM10513.1 succinyl-CoA synthetase, alpha subunit [Thermanaerovibrio velox DSM 12556]
MVQRIEVVERTYYDSVTLMRVAKEINSMEGISSASLSMGTEANLRILAAAGYDLSGLCATPNDLIIAVMGEPDLLDGAVAKAREYLSNPPWKQQGQDGGGVYRPKSIDGALSVLGDANLAVVSVAGRYAGDVATDCISKGLNVMLYSDNVPLEKEIEVKRAAAEKGLLVMGPDCGTVIIRGVAIGMANVCPVGPVSMVAAAGTGLQEVHVQLARRGVGTLHGIGTGGRDVKSEVGGIMVEMASRLLLEDPEVKVLVILGKPPAPEVEEKILKLASGSQKPVVLGFIGGKASGDRHPVYICRELEETAAVAAALAKGEDVGAVRSAMEEEDRKIRALAEQIGLRKGYLRGLYSGGTLCYEAQLIAQDVLGPIHSNTPLRKELKLEDSLRSVEHSIVDFGEDEFTQGRLHPMIDVSLRASRFEEEAKDPEVGVILFDVVIGYGCNPDPASGLVEGIQKARKLAGDRVVFVASVCGTPDDPQDSDRQRKTLEDAGVVVMDSNAKASRLAAYLLKG